MKKIGLLVVSAAILVSCSGRGGTAVAEGEYTWEYPSHDGAGAVRLVSEPPTATELAKPDVYIDGEHVGQSDVLEWRDTSTPEQVASWTESTGCITIETMITVLAGTFYDGRDAFSEARTAEMGAFLQYLVDLGDERGCNTTVNS